MIDRDLGIMAGVELEASVTNGSGKPVDVRSYIERTSCDGRFVVDGVGIITTDAGWHQVEGSLDPSCLIEEHEWMASQFLKQLPADWEASFVGRDPYCSWEELWSDQFWCPAPRYQSLRQAAEEDVAEFEQLNWRGILGMTNWNSTHIHLGIPPYSPEGIRAINYLNNWGPAIAVYLSGEIYSTRLERAWWGWTRPNRGVSYNHWYQSPQQMLDSVMDLPVLLEEIEGQIVPSQRMMTRLLPIQESTTWWGVRPRKYNGNSEGTVEFRYLDSIYPSKLSSLLTTFFGLLDKCLCSSNDLPLLSEKQWWSMMMGQDYRSAGEFISTILCC
jgi:hypothetical protein